MCPFLKIAKSAESLHPRVCCDAVSCDSGHYSCRSLLLVIVAVMPVICGFVQVMADLQYWRWADDSGILF